MRWEKPESYGDVFGRHFPFALGPALILIASALIPYQSITYRICVFRKLTDHPCPFCGYSRSFSAITDGHWVWAFHNSPFTVVLYGLTVVLLVWNVVPLLTGYRLLRGPALQFPSRRFWTLIWVFIGFLVLNWGYRLAMGLK